MNYLDVRKELLKIGLSEHECESFSEDEAFQYLRFYTVKENQKLSIAFIGFSDSESSSLISSVDNSCFKTYKNLSKDLNFICLAEMASEKETKKAMHTPATILSTTDFHKIFSSNYNLFKNKLLYNLNVSETFRIAKPLSNFNKNINIDSFSDANEKVYTANLYNMHCSCTEFGTQHKSMYPLGDLRRLCKHLIFLYKTHFGIYSVSPLAQCVFDNGYGLAGKFRNIRIERITYDVIVNFNQELGWWDLYVPNKDGVYTKYGYSSIERRFSYNRKPIGIIPELRGKLILLEKDFFLYPYERNINGVSNQSSNGCLSSIMIIVSIILYYICY